MSFLLALCLCLGFASTVQAQSPECDGAPPASISTVSVGTSFTFGWCSPAADSFKVYRNGVAVANPVVTTATQPNSAGLFYSTVRLTEAVAGSVTFEVSAVKLGAVPPESAKHGPFVLTVSPGQPPAPTKGRILGS